MLDGIISDPNAPILALCDKTKLTSLLDGGSSDYGKPFFGQLMAGPQFIGYIVQMNYLLRDYKVRIQKQRADIFCLLFVFIPHFLLFQ